MVNDGVGDGQYVAKADGIIIPMQLSLCLRVRVCVQACAAEQPAHSDMSCLAGCMLASTFLMTSSMVGLLAIR